MHSQAGRTCRSDTTEISQNPIWSNFSNSPVRDETDTSGIYVFHQTVSYITAVGNPKVVPACVPVFSRFTKELHVVICDMVFIIAIFINNTNSSPL